MREMEGVCTSWKCYLQYCAKKRDSSLWGEKDNCEFSEAVLWAASGGHGSKR